MANEYLKRIPTSTGNRKVVTISAWYKNNKALSTGGHTIFSSGMNPTSPDGRHQIDLVTNSNPMWQFEQYGFPTAGGSIANYYARDVDRKFRDFSSWSHIMVSFDSTKPREQDRAILYHNGVRFDKDSGSSNFPLNFELPIGVLTNNLGIKIGNGVGALQYGDKYFNGELTDYFFVDGQALTPDVFGFYKDGDGYQSSGTTNATDFRPGEWMPHAPRVIKKSIERSGGFGVNGFYLPMNDSSNPGADFHCDPNSIIKLKGEDLPQPRNGAPTTSDAFVSELRQETGTLGFDGAVAFDGDGDYLSIPDDSDVDLGNGDFTIEGYYYFRNTGSSGTNFWGKWADVPGRSYGFSYVKSTGKYVFPYSTDGSNETLSAEFESEADINRWVHFAAVRNGTSLKVYRDGKEIISHNIGTTTIYNSSSNLLIGRLESNTNFDLDGFVSNFRVVKGTALYTANFTAPTEPLTNVTNTVLLCCQSSTDATAATVIPTGAITDNGNPFATRNELTGYTVLAVPGASTVIGPDIVNNGYEWTGASGTTPPTGWDDEELDGVETYSVNSSGQLVYDRNGESEDPGRFSQDLTTVNGNVYHLVLDLVATTGGGLVVEVGGTLNVFASTTVTGIKRYTFTATSTTTKITIRSSSVNGTLTIDNVKVRQVDDAPRDYSADIKGSGTNKTLTANGNAGVGYELGGYYGSAMTFDGSGDYLSDTTTTDFLMNNEDFTAEAWVYYDGVSVPGQIVGIWGNNGNNRSWMLYHNSTPKIKFAVNTGNGGGGGTLAVGDYTPVVGQWYHLAGEKEGTTIRLYVNGVCVGTSNSALTSLYNSNAPLTIGAYGVGGSPAYFEGRIQDVRLYKGVAKYKGGFDVPKPYTPVGIESWRTTADTCKNNFATFNPLKRTSNQTLSDGNLTCTQAGQVWGACASTIAMDESSGKYYVEYRVESNLYSYIGIANANSLVFDLATVPSGYTFMGATSNDWGYLSSNGGIQHNNSNLVSGGAILNAGDILGITFDTSNKEAKWYANGVLQYTTTLTGNYPFFFASGSYQSSNIVNFGQNPSFSGTTTAGTNADDSGKGLFKYAPPTGFLALCEDNLPAPAIADPGEHFKCVLYGGDSNSGHSITGVGFKPDFVWIKNRDTSQSHYLFDTIRGVDQVLWTDLPNEENDYTASGGRMPSFDSNGFTVNYSSSTGTNASGDNYVAWCWKAGGAAVSNTDGTITSQVSANQDAGFSIVSYTGTGANATVGHGLGKAPSFVIVKNRDSALNWAIWHSAIAGNQYFRFTTNDVTDLGTVWNSSIPTSSIINLGSSIVTNESTSRFIAYVWTEIENYSKFGSYIGNDGPDGPFVYCGFKPAFVLTKLSSDINGHWILWDSSRTPTNLATTALSPNNSWTDTNGFDIDLLSNGFKQRDTETSLNVSGETYIFAAFAESPFQTANAK